MLAGVTLDKAGALHLGVDFPTRIDIKPAVDFIFALPVGGADIDALSTISHVLDGERHVDGMAIHEGAVDGVSAAFGGDLLVHQPVRRAVIPGHQPCEAALVGVGGEGHACVLAGRIAIMLILSQARLNVNRPHRSAWPATHRED